MEVWHRVLLTRLFALAALAISAALLMNDLHPNPGFCGFQFDCEAVLFSDYSRALGIPLPVFGIVTFGALLGLTLFPGQRTDLVRRLLALAAGLAGISLIVVQTIVLRQLCPYCLTVDLLAVACAVVEVSGFASQPVPAFPAWRRYLWGGAGLASLGLGVVFGSLGAGETNSATGPVPLQVSALWVPGKVNIVEVADFECPHCRKMHAILQLLLDEEGERVHLARLTAPMPMHAHARYASRAFLCAQEQGRGNEMADALFAARDLGPGACERYAVSLGLSLPEYRACVARPDIDQTLDAEVAWVKAISRNGLPIVWVQDRLFPGEQSIDTLRDAVAAAAEQLSGAGREPGPR
jgi:uncharacterized membrane protein/predicted DsbA family dithiol-disulfide isomerase